MFPSWWSYSSHPSRAYSDYAQSSSLIHYFPMPCPSFIGRNKFQIHLLQIEQKDKSFNCPESFITINYTLYKSNKPHMKITSPFVEYIPDCKKNMRRLRKKIYKFITSKNYHKKQQDNRNDLLTLFKDRQVPSFVVDLLSKKKAVDLNAIKNLNVNVRLPLKDLIEITERQEKVVNENHKEWLQTNRNRIKQKAYAYMESLKERESLSKRTLSSTEFECDEEYEEDYASNAYNQESHSQLRMNQNLNQDIQFHHFQRGNSFLQIESSILSQENLFKFQQ